MSVHVMVITGNASRKIYGDKAYLEQGPLRVCTAIIFYLLHFTSWLQKGLFCPISMVHVQLHSVSWKDILSASLIWLVYAYTGWSTTVFPALIT